MPNIQNFKGSFQDLARANRYEVQGFGAQNDLKYMARTASAPAANIGVVDAAYQGRIIKLPGDRTYEDWTMTLYYNTNNAEYNFFYIWHDLLNEAVLNTTLTQTVGLSGKLSDGRVSLMDRTGDRLKTWILIGAIPVNISAIEFGADTNDTIAEFTVTFAYDYHLVI
jgi:hypothetical protein